MKIKLLLAAAVIGSAVIFFGCFREKSLPNQAEVSDAVAAEAVAAAQEVLSLAQSKKDRDFVKKTVDFKKNRDGYYECYLLLQNVRPAADAKWKVRQEKSNGNINVICPLNKKRDLLIVLQRQTDNKLKFAFACTLNS
ncbi:MAG: hypothetical protein IJZ19_00095 [Lentisphaeria bacterium]|nr:hypothetical protein [Lentisphaeria bacterium]MBQ9776742.1 hypothetical protein [Lentisphaeria bacterium]